LDAIDCLEVRTVPKEESVPFLVSKEELGPFSAPKAVKVKALNEGCMPVQTDAMRDAHLVAVPSKPGAAATGQNASTLPAVRLR
jgi:hypothetical protein